MVSRLPCKTGNRFCGLRGVGIFWENAPMKITDVLRAEHAVFHNLFDHIESVVPRLKTVAEVRALAAAVLAVLAPHARTEDDLFMEPLEHCFDQIGQQETFHDEHELIDAELTKVHKAREVKAAKKILLGAVTPDLGSLDLGALGLGDLGGLLG